MNLECFNCVEIPGRPGYRVDRDGNVYSCWQKRGSAKSRLSDRWIKLKPAVQKGGYLNFRLKNGDRYLHHLAHRLVLESFVGSCPSGMQACHNDNNPQNNKLENLRWDTPKSNQADRIIFGTSNRGENHGNHKLTAPEISEILSLRKNTSLSLSKIGAIFGVCKQTIFKILSKKSWKHLT